MSLTRPDARTLIDTFLDPGTWRSWDETPIDKERRSDAGSERHDQFDAAA